MIGIEIFSGAGGMSLGALKAGIITKIAVEIDFNTAQTYSANNSSTFVINDDISNINYFQFEKKNEPVILFGGPPCQGFSNSNQKNRSVNNPKNWLFKEFLRCTKLIMPDWVVIENVVGLVSLNRGFFLEEIVSELNKLKYTVNYKILNAVDFGVPQKRKRIFIVASLHNIKFEFPTPNSDNFINVGEAISDLPELKNGDLIYSLPYRSKPITKYAKEMRQSSRKSRNNNVSKNSDLILERYRYIPQGGNWQNIPNRLMKNYEDKSRCHGGIYRRLLENEPSIVIGNYRKNMLIHPNVDRGLSVREAARLQSFPDWYIFKGPLVAQQQQVGDAVPPKLAEAVFKQIIQQNR
jgi:DNA (cytosine-5)-methyltransferase 1